MTGRVFEVEGGIIGIAEVPSRSPLSTRAPGGAGEIGPVVADLLAEPAAPTPVYNAADRNSTPGAADAWPAPWRRSPRAGWS